MLATAKTNRARRLLPALAPLVLLVLSCVPEARTHAPTRARRVLVIAHRGVHTTSAENTLGAFSRAIELGCDYVEVDVRQTRDGALVLMHDSTVDRTTSGTGKVEDLTLAEVRALDVDVGSNAGQRVGVPTLDETLALCRGRIRVLIDNKDGPPSRVVAAIRAHDMLGGVTVYDGVEELREFRRLAPELWIQPPHPGSSEAITSLVADLRPETLDGNAVEWNREQVDAAHQAGTQVWVDNLGVRDNEAGVRTSVEMGVDGIQTDWPEMTIRMLERFGLRGPQPRVWP